MNRGFIFKHSITSQELHWPVMKNASFGGRFLVAVEPHSVSGH